MAKVEEVEDLEELIRAVSEPSNWIVYILECADQTLYTGVTNDLDRRINEHENGRAHGPAYYHFEHD